jgi:hypothetical protein
MSETASIATYVDAENEVLSAANGAVAADMRRAYAAAGSLSWGAPRCSGGLRGEPRHLITWSSGCVASRVWVKT